MLAGHSCDHVQLVEHSLAQFGVLGLQVLAVYSSASAARVCQFSAYTGKFVHTVDLQGAVTHLVQLPESAASTASFLMAGLSAPFPDSAGAHVFAPGQPQAASGADTSPTNLWASDKASGVLPASSVHMSTLLHMTRYNQVCVADASWSPMWRCLQTTSASRPTSVHVKRTFISCQGARSIVILMCQHLKQLQVWSWAIRATAPAMAWF